MQVRFISNVGFILLGVFLILTGLSLLGLMIPGIITGVIALISGILILLGI